MDHEFNEAEDQGKNPVNQPQVSEDKAETAKEKNKEGNLWQSLYLYLHDAVYILAAVMLVFVFLFRVVTVSGSSMYPTLVNQDYVALLSNVFYHGDQIENGDVVVALVPAFDKEPIVKRVIATEGQTVNIDYLTGIVYVDGVALDEPYINEPIRGSWGDRGVTFPYTVEEGHVFLMGDNRNHSSDSRLLSIGQVDTRYILGKVTCVMVPGPDEVKNDERDFGRIGAVS